MKRNVKVVISILLCFLMLFVEMMPVGILPARIFAENSIGDEAQNSIESSEADNLSNPVSVTDSVYGVGEESVGKSEEESLKIEDTNGTVLLESTSSGGYEVLNEYVISGTVFLPEGYVAPSEGLNLRIYAKSSKTNSVNVAIPGGENKVEYSVIVPGEGDYTLYYQAR